MWIQREHSAEEMPPVAQLREVASMVESLSASSGGVASFDRDMVIAASGPHSEDSCRRVGRAIENQWPRAGANGFGGGGDASGILAMQVRFAARISAAIAPIIDGDAVGMCSGHDLERLHCRRS